MATLISVGFALFILGTVVGLSMMFLSLYTVDTSHAKPLFFGGFGLWGLGSLLGLISTVGALFAHLLSM